MGRQTTFHAPGHGTDFLGWRINRSGATEIVYEDGAARRTVFRVCTNASDEDGMAEAMHLAVRAMRVVPTLLDELKKRAIDVERLTN